MGRRIVDGARSVRLFGEEIAVKAHVHTLGGFSAHADQKGLLEWVSHVSNPQLEVFVNHGEEKISIELGRLIGEQFHFKTNIPQWREVRFLFVPEGHAITEMVAQERITPEKESGEEEIAPAEESFSVLFKHLDRNYKKLRRKWRRERSKGKDVLDRRWLKQLKEINEKIEDLESRLE
jgi:metallo-beta-lactamase family protein